MVFYAKHSFSRVKSIAYCANNQNRIENSINTMIRKSIENLPFKSLIIRANLKNNGKEDLVHVKRSRTRFPPCCNGLLRAVVLLAISQKALWPRTAFTSVKSCVRSFDLFFRMYNLRRGQHLRLYWIFRAF